MNIFEYWQEHKKPMSLDAICENLQLVEKALARHREEQDLVWIAHNRDEAIWSSPDPDIPVGTVCYDAQAGEYKILREGGSWTSLSIG